MRRVVYVSGPPGAGKTTLARPLATALGWPLIRKDTIKEALADTLAGETIDLAESRRLGGAAMEVLWSLAREAENAVLEANFRPNSDYERERLEALAGHLVEVHCRCPIDVVMQRFADRARTPANHRVHIFAGLTPEYLAEYPGPVGIGVLIDVDTTAPVDIPGLASRVRAAMAASA